MRDLSHEYGGITVDILRHTNYWAITVEIYVVAMNRENCVETQNINKSASALQQFCHAHAAAHFNPIVYKIFIFRIPSSNPVQSELNRVKEPQVEHRTH